MKSIWKYRKRSVSNIKCVKQKQGDTKIVQNQLEILKEKGKCKQNKMCKTETSRYKDSTKSIWKYRKRKCKQNKMCKTETRRYKDSTKSIGSTEREREREKNYGKGILRK